MQRSHGVNTMVMVLDSGRKNRGSMASYMHETERAWV